MPPRQAPKRYRVKKRAWAKYALQKKHEAQFLEVATLAVVAMRVSADPRRRRLFMIFALYCLAEVEQINTLVEGVILPIEQRIVLFATQNEGLFPIFHRFKLGSMRRLAHCLRLPAWFKLANGSWVQGEHALIIFLRLFATYNRLVDVETLAGFELTKVCRIRTATIFSFCSSTPSS